MEPTIIFVVLLLAIILLSPITYTLSIKLYKTIKRSVITSYNEEEKISIIQEIQTAVDALVDAEKGATIVIDKKNETNEYVTDSEIIDSRIAANLIINIFEGSKTPLHDGAIIIKENRIDRASAYIKNLSQQEMPKKFGTRHRAALGLAEVTKSIIIVISEETSKIRVFYNSKWEEVSKRDLFGKLVDLWV